MKKEWDSCLLGQRVFVVNNMRIQSDNKHEESRSHGLAFSCGIFALGRYYIWGISF